MSLWDRFWSRSFPFRPYVPAGSSRLNMTGEWRSHKPIIHADKCINCDLCWIFCPEGVVGRPRKEARYTINYDFCKGCGICAEGCPTKAIEMVTEA